MSMDVDNEVIIDLTTINDSTLVQQIKLIVAENENQKKMLHEFSSQLESAHAEIQELRAHISKHVEVRNLSRNEVRTADAVDNGLPHKRLKTDSTNVAPPQLPPVGVAAKKQKKVFHIIETDVKTVKKQLLNINCEDFTIKQASVKAPIKVVIGSHDDVPKIRDTYIKSNISCHEFKLEEEKSKCFLIRRLTGVTDADLPEIKDVLIKNGLPADITLALYISGYMRANPTAAANSLIKLILPPNCDTKVLQKIKVIDHVVVRIEVFKNKSIMQCNNCQRFGHSAGGCMHQHRCVKCGTNHLKADCPRSSDKSVKLYCCNCGGEHTANNLSVCPFFLKNHTTNLPPAGKFNKEASAPGPNKANFERVPELSYAAVSGKGTSSSSNNKRIAPGTSNNQSSTSLNDLAQKIDMIFRLVTKHETLLQNMYGNA